MDKNNNESDLFYLARSIQEAGQKIANSLPDTPRISFFWVCFMIWISSWTIGSGLNHIAEALLTIAEKMP